MKQWQQASLQAFVGNMQVLFSVATYLQRTVLLTVSKGCKDRFILPFAHSWLNFEGISDFDISYM